MPASPKQRKMAVVGSRSVGQSSVISTEHWHLLRAQTLTVLGKSSLTVQFVDGHFVDSYYPTIENTFSKVIKHRSQDFATEIVDTAGQVSPPLVQSQNGQLQRSTILTFGAPHSRMSTAYSIPSTSWAFMATCWSTLSLRGNHLR